MTKTPICAEKGCIKLDSFVGDCNDPTPNCSAFPEGIPTSIAYKGATCPFFLKPSFYDEALT
jgi:hypothetical protein